MTTPTNRLLILSLSVLGVSIVTTALGSILWVFGLSLFLALIAITILDLSSTLPARLLLAKNIDLPNYLYLGSDSRLIIELEESVWFRQTVFKVIPKLSSHMKIPNVALIRFMPDEPLSIEINLTPVRRGRAHIEVVDVFWKSPRKLLQFKKQIVIDKEVKIVPNIKALKDMANRLFSRDSFYGLKIQSYAGEGSEFEALKEYQPGLDIRSIDWKHTARHMKIMCKEYEIERNHNILLAFDKGHLMSESFDSISHLDYSINAGLQMSLFALWSGDKVGACDFGAEFGSRLEPVKGIGRHNSLSDYTSGIAYSEEETNYSIALIELNGWLRRRTMVVIFSDFIDTITAEIMVENMRLITSKHLVVFVTYQDSEIVELLNGYPSSKGEISQSIMAHAFLKERQIVLRKIAALGVHVVETRKEQIATAVLNKYLEIKRKELI